MANFTVKLLFNMFVAIFTEVSFSNFSFYSMQCHIWNRRLREISNHVMLSSLFTCCNTPTVTRSLAYTHVEVML